MLTKQPNVHISNRWCGGCCTGSLRELAERLWHLQFQMSPQALTSSQNMGKEWGWRGHSRFACTMTPRDSILGLNSLSVHYGRGAQIFSEQPTVSSTALYVGFMQLKIKDSQVGFFFFFFKSSYFLIKKDMV